MLAAANRLKAIHFQEAITEEKNALAYLIKARDDVKRMLKDSRSSAAARASVARSCRNCGGPRKKSRTKLPNWPLGSVDWPTERTRSTRRFRQWPQMALRRQHDNERMGRKPKEKQVHRSKRRADSDAGADINAPRRVEQRWPHGSRRRRSTRPHEAPDDEP